jgi:sugar transferase EpsL
VKRVLDIGLTLLTLPLWAPALLVLTVLVRVRLGGAIFFTQLRPGLHGQPFRLIKLRSMTDERDAEGKLLSDERRLTEFGRWLRASSLDELPELWNVLKGDMSLVGPRPLLVEYLPLYTSDQARRHLVRPGITGWAQINGRNAISWEDKFRLDVWYVDHHSLWLDLKILWITMSRVIQRQGITAHGESTMPPFRGGRS